MNRLFKKNRRIGLLTLCFVSTFFFASSQNISFTRISPPKEFSFTLITGITQDVQGYMWFSSGDMLIRYNGYEFTTYKTDPRNPNSLSGFRLETVYADKKGFIWVGDFGLGLNKLDPRTGIFSHYRFNPSDPASISNDTVTAITGDRNGGIWVGTPRGLNRLDVSTGKFIRYQYKANDASSLSNNGVRAIYEDKAGTIWVGTGSAFYEDGVHGKSEGGLNKLDLKTGKFTRYLHNPDNKYSLIDNRVRAIFEDSRGIFWVGTAGDGLHTMDRARGVFQRHVYDPEHPEKLSRPPLQKKIPFADDHISFINEDVTGAIWIGTFQGGLNRYDPKTGITRHYGANKTADSLHENGPFIMYSSREGIIWLSTWERDVYNLYTIDPFKKNIPHISIGSPVRSFQEDKQGRLWLGTSNGLLLCDKDYKIINQYKHDPANSNSLSDDRVGPLKMDREGILWIGAETALNSFDPVSKKFTAYKKRPFDPSGIGGAEMLWIFEDSKGGIWTATTDGLYLLDKKTQKFSQYKHNDGDKNSLSNSTVTSMVEDKKGDLWIGAWNGGGINRLKKGSSVFSHDLSGLNVSSIYQDADGTIWAGTFKGLYYKTKEEEAFTLYSDPGSSIENANILTIIEDDHQNLWVSSFTALFRINRRQQETSIYGLNQGVNPSTLFYLSGYKLSNEKLLFGTGTGFYSFFPNELIGKSKPPQIVITGFHTGNETGNSNSVKEALDEKPIELNYDQNSFSFTFAGIHYSGPDENRHLFILENYDKGWRKAGAERTASYFQIPPGNYIFRVKAASKDGIWAEKKIPIIITPPWWGTWKFRIVALLSIISIFYGVIRWRTHQKFKLQLERSERETEVADLRRKTSELEMHALRSQMSPHFIFNSLNAINRFILQNNRAQASEYLTKFSRLVRLILQNSQAALISLESELDALQLYLELEALRFEQHFEFKINVDKELDLSMLKVPPLIIQPYAENAVWHGLMHKEERGHLVIDLFQKDEVLYCKITDDGIGRKRAAELKSKSANTHKSMGMRITADRIALLQKQKQMNTSIVITDLVLPDGSPGGTEVLLKLPVTYD